MMVCFMLVVVCMFWGRFFGIGLLFGDCRIKVFGGVMFSVVVDCWYEVMMMLILVGIIRYRYNVDFMI